MSNYLEGFEDGVRATKAEYLKLLEEESHPVKELKNIVLASATCSCGKVMEVTNLQPVKELTDEEIRHIQAQCHLKDVGYDGFIMRFARAILLKAQEK